MERQTDKSLQKLTDFAPATVLPPLDRVSCTVGELESWMSKVNKLIGDAYEQKDSDTLTTLVNELKRDHRPVWDVQVRNRLWQHNHRLIQSAINDHMRKYAGVPTTQELARETGLSRQTVSKHLKEFQTESLYQDQVQMLRYMETSLLSKLYELGMQGDTRAIKLYLSVVGNKSAGQANLVGIASRKIDISIFSCLPEKAQAKISELVFDYAKQLNRTAMR